jgi:BirA family transcriptional regulator, biotin operon repressor / biotin---[acetyl-CoA-carboxylase] ligase
VTEKINKSIIDDVHWKTLIQQGEIVGHPLVHFAEIDSTNCRAMKMGKAGAPSGTVVLAECQTGGKGRLGRLWLSPVGSGLYFSVILRPSLEPGDLSKITLASGVALCRTVRALYHIMPEIKWPNDLLIDKRKCGGILVEADLHNLSSPLIIVGIGINITTLLEDFPKELQEKVTSLQYHVDGTILRSELLTNILRQLDTIIEQFEQQGFGGILTEWKNYDATRGRNLTWITSDRTVVQGVSLGPDSEGRLHIQSSDGRIHEVISGDIQLNSYNPEV